MLKKILAIVSLATAALFTPLAFAGGELEEDSYPTVITEMPASALDLAARAFGVVSLVAAGVAVGLRYAKTGRWPSAAVVVGIPSGTLACAALTMLLSYGSRATLTLGAVNVTAGAVLGAVAYAALLGCFALFAKGERPR